MNNIDNIAPIISQQPIVLVGMMGSGKSSVGRRLAEALGWDFVDVDDEIIAASQMSIEEYFQTYGEAEFRALERRVLTRLMTEKPCVIATGGGAFISEENRELLLSQSSVVFLDADLETLWARVKDKTHRPLLQTANPKASLTAIYEARLPIYQLAPYHVPSLADQPHEEVVNRIINSLGRA